MRDVPIIPMGEEPDGDTSAGDQRPRPWQTIERLSSTANGGGGDDYVPRWSLDAAERFLCDAGFDRAPWLAVVFAAGIIAWFFLSGRWKWCGAIAAGGVLAAGCGSACSGGGCGLRGWCRFLPRRRWQPRPRSPICSSR